MRGVLGSSPSLARNRCTSTSMVRSLGVRSVPLTASIKRAMFHPAFPVDRRHNAKIHREELAQWASAR